MLTFLIAATIGAYLSRRIDAGHDSTSADVSINYSQIWKDAIAFFTFLGALCNWFIASGRSARNYFDLALLPWLSQRGIRIQLPSVQLPVMPTANLQID